MSRRLVLLGRVGTPRPGAPVVPTGRTLTLFVLEKDIFELAMRAGDRLAVDERGRVLLQRVVPLADLARASAAADAATLEGTPAEVTP